MLIQVSTSLYTVFTNFIKKLFALVKLNIYYFTCFHANPASTYYSYVSDEVEQFAWDHRVSGRARICTWIGGTLKAIGFLLHQVNMPESLLSKCCECSDGDKDIYLAGWG